jgi:hypothetical protein
MASQGTPREDNNGGLAAPQTVNVGVTMHAADTKPNLDDGPVPLWIAIRNRRVDFTAYSDFIKAAFCPTDSMKPVTTPLQQHLKAVMVRMRDVDSGSGCSDLGQLGHGINAYELLKTATEIFLLLECGVFIAGYGLQDANGKPPRTIPGAEDNRVDGDLALKNLQAALTKYLGDPKRLPYIDKVLRQTTESNPTLVASLFCDGMLTERVDCPCFLELIWSYWHEEGMLVQSLNALSMRFQNRRVGDGRDPLAQLELSPLRPLSTIFWGYVQDEQHRLSLARRSCEYEHEYGVALRGKAVPNVRVADRRSKFIEAFHDLMFRCTTFYKEQSNLQYRPDTFPLLNGIKEVHLQLSQGAGNQFGDLPWTARAEMLMQQWILARPEIGAFLGRRPMVAYDEAWMASADALKTLMGWSDTSVTHFHNLAVMGEKLLLSIRWHAWGSESNADVARDWADYFKPEIQGYVHAYRVATGIDLSLEPKGPNDQSERAQNPAILLERRLDQQHRDAPR